MKTRLTKLEHRFPDQVAVPWLAFFWVLAFALQIAAKAGSGTFMISMVGSLLALSAGVVTFGLYIVRAVIRIIRRRKSKKPLTPESANCWACEYALDGQIPGFAHVVRCPECGDLNAAIALPLPPLPFVDAKREKEYGRIEDRRSRIWGIVGLFIAVSALYGLVGMVAFVYVCIRDWTFSPYLPMFFHPHVCLLPFWTAMIVYEFWLPLYDRPLIRAARQILLKETIERARVSENVAVA